MSLPDDLRTTVTNALREDVGSGDITAQLVPAETLATAVVFAREEAILCGSAWVNEVMRQVDPDIRCHWHCQDGARVSANTPLLTLAGRARALLTAERCALNFLQTLSGTATLCRQHADLVAHTPVRLLDTRKTIPGLRTAQKYAVTVGGCHNHRMGLFDAFLIKENHIRACGSIAAAVSAARRLFADRPVEVEVESLDELEQALAAGADTIMLDNFTLPLLRVAVAHTAGRVPLEASGGINQATLVPVAETGVDYISIGALTKDCRAIDLSMLFQSPLPQTQETS
jgi:nicotinate-nucleotide pyrophosphorylase (carboxylating)